MIFTSPSVLLILVLAFVFQIVILLFARSKGIAIGRISTWGPHRDPKEKRSVTPTFAAGSFSRQSMIRNKNDGGGITFPSSLLAQQAQPGGSIPSWAISRLGKCGTAL